MLTRGTVLAVVGGAFVGALAGLLSRPTLPPASESAPFAPVTSPARQPQEPRKKRTPKVTRPATVERAPETTEAPAAAAKLPEVKTVAFPHWAPLTGKPTTKAELTQVLARCGHRDGRACLAAGVASEHGFGTALDTKEADRFKRIALNFLGRHCEQRDAMACVDLAEMYRRGIIVAVDNGRADFLLSRARELCKIRPTAGCAELP